MSDIVDDLRLGLYVEPKDAADEIERNRAAIDELVGALKYARSNGIFATFVISDLDAAIAKHQSTTKE